MNHACGKNEESDLNEAESKKSCFPNKIFISLAKTNAQWEMLWRIC